VDVSFINHMPSYFDKSKGILSSLEGHGYDKVRKGLVSVILKKALLDIGADTYYKVLDVLRKRHQCYLPDCYEHPEYLNDILKDLYGNSYRQIIKSICKELEEFSNQEPIAKFIKALLQ
jgi:hypothetical protein